MNTGFWTDPTAGIPAGTRPAIADRDSRHGPRGGWPYCYPGDMDGRARDYDDPLMTRRRRGFSLDNAPAAYGP